MRRREFITLLSGAASTPKTGLCHVAELVRGSIFVSWTSQERKLNSTDMVNWWREAPTSCADHLDAATKRRHGRTFSTRCSRSGLAVERRRPYLASDASGSATEGLLLHCAPSSNGW
jgi:hypothetical protein